MTDAAAHDRKRALLAEATKKAAIVWLTVGDRRPYAVWCLPVGESIYVVTGPGEQPAPGLVCGPTVRIGARGDHGGLILMWDATVERVMPGSDAWSAVAPPLAAKRLNAPGPAEALVDRWARECVVLALHPIDR
jgi:hypothetical protein